MATATDELMECDECDGSGEVHSHNPRCWECRGKGKIPKSQYEARKKREAEAIADRKRREFVDSNWWIMTDEEKDQVYAIANEAKRRSEKD